MTMVPITERDLHAYADGRLDPARRADVERYLASNAEAAERVAEYARQNVTLREVFASVLSEPVPQRMVNAASRLQRRRGALVAASWAAVGAIVGLVFGGFAGWSLHPDIAQLEAREEPALLVRSAAIAHATYSPEVRHPVEVGADQEAHLVAWLSKRLGAPIRAPKFDAEGFKLVGGRLLPGESPEGAPPSQMPSPTAQFMYQSARGRRVTLYLRTEAADEGETAFRFAREGGIGVFYWIDHGFGYALSSSDLDRAALLALANDAYRQLNP